MIDIEKLKGHTPGPWEVASSSSGHKTCITLKGTTEWNGAVGFAVIRAGAAKTMKEAEANTTLMSVAPQLLAEAERQRKEIYFLKYDRQNLYGALKKTYDAYRNEGGPMMFDIVDVISHYESKVYE